MARRPQTLMDQLRQAILDAPITRYRISKELGITQSSLSKFVNGLSILHPDDLDAVAEMLGISIRIDYPARLSPTEQRAGGK